MQGVIVICGQLGPEKSPGSKFPLNEELLQSEVM
jgi:hypothetical protein